MCRLLFGWRKSNSREHGASHPTFRYSTYCKFKILFLEDIPASFETQPFETWETLHSAELLAWRVDMKNSRLSKLNNQRNRKTHLWRFIFDGLKYNYRWSHLYFPGLSPGLTKEKLSTCQRQHLRSIIITIGVLEHKVLKWKKHGESHLVKL